MTPVLWTSRPWPISRKSAATSDNFNPYAARAVADRIIEIGNSLASFPHRGRRVPGTQLRENTVVRPYVVRYQVYPDRVVILRIRDGARRPTHP